MDVPCGPKHKATSKCEILPGKHDRHTASTRVATRYCVSSSRQKSCGRVQLCRARRLRHVVIVEVAEVDRSVESV